MASKYANPVTIKPTYHTPFPRFQFGVSFEERKRLFLEQYKSPTGKRKYKRYLGSTLRYAGGKSLATGMIVEMLPNKLEKIVSPFFGGGSFEIACAKELGLEVIGYDIFDLLVNYRQFQAHKPKELARELKKYTPTKEGFLEAKEIMRQHWMGEKKIRSNKRLAGLFYFNHNTSYGPHVLGRPSSVYLQEKRYAKMVDKVKNFDAGSLSVYCENFMDIMDQHKNDFMYCDPPYYLDGDSKTFVGLYPHRNFPIHHKGFDHEGLRDKLLNHKGGFILSYNDCSTIREWYKGFDMLTPKRQYTFSQGDTRIGKNRTENSNGSHIKQSLELIIYKLPS